MSKNPPKNSKFRLNLDLSRSFYEEFKRQAKREKRTVSGLVRYLMADYLSKRNKIASHILETVSEGNDYLDIPVTREEFYSYWGEQQQILSEKMLFLLKEIEKKGGFRKERRNDSREKTTSN